MADAVVLGTVALQAAIILTLLEGLRRGNVPAAVNASVSFGATLLPLVAAIGADVGRQAALGSGLILWVALAGFLHSLGMLGPYDTVRWWDLLTHGVSAALVAAIVYAAAIVTSGPDAMAAAVAVAVGVTLVAGIFWELIELVARDFEDRFGIDPVLVHYGWRDTAVDLVVDAVAAVVVVAVDVRVFVPFARRIPRATQIGLVGATVVLVLGSLVMAAWIWIGIEEVP